MALINITTTLDELDKLDVFPEFTNADYAMRDWRTAIRTIEAWRSEKDVTSVVVSYSQAIEKFLNFAIRQRGSTAPFNTHKLILLAEEAGLNVAPEWRSILSKLTEFYFDGRYEWEGKETRAALYDFFDYYKIEQLDLITRACYELCVATYNQAQAGVRSKIRGLRLE